MTPSQNSLVVFCKDLLNNLKDDIARTHPACSKEIQRDFSSLTTRLVHEGLPFVTSTLPSLGREILNSFTTGKLRCPQGFKAKRGTTLPLILSGLLVQGYTSDGQLKETVDSKVIRSLLQCCFTFYKFELPFTEAQINRKIEAFMSAEADLRELNLAADDIVISTARDLIRDLFREFNPREIVPGHGPGALATGEKNEGKWEFKRKFTKLHAFYPYYEYFVPSRTSLLNDPLCLKQTTLKWYRSLERRDSSVSQVRLVPKDSRGPRIISMEELEHQFIQQGLKNSLYSHLETHPLSKGYINFTHQTINQQLALRGSKDGSVATLDMKEASDRVSLQLVRCLFSGTDLLPALEAVRSQYTELPGNCKYPQLRLELYKYAPMGSAVCFPVEAVCFWALSKALIAVEKGEANFAHEQKVWVYGDDIIVDTVHARTLMEGLPKYGLLVNEGKSYYKGPFRESCGFDCFNGEVVTPIKLKELPQCEKWSCDSLTSYCEYSNLFQQNGYYAVARFIRNLPGLRRLPTLPYHTGMLTFVGSDESLLKTKWDPGFQKKLDLVPLAKISTKESQLDGRGRFLANLLGKYSRSYVVPHATHKKLRWIDLTQRPVNSYDVTEGQALPRALTDLLHQKLSADQTLRLVRVA